MYDVIKGLNTLAAIVALAYIANKAQSIGEDGGLILTIVYLIGALGGFYIADLVRKRNGV